MKFTEEYKNIKALAQDELSVIEGLMTERIDVREPLNTMLIKYLSGPSKRVRPVLGILLAKAHGETLSQKQLEFLAVIELIHNASLIHDDIIDECGIRRGNKTIGAEYNNKLAVISGDYILSVAMEMLNHIGNPELTGKVTQTVKQMCNGEINQDFDRFKIGTIENYLEKTKNKTAYLFETTLSGTMMLDEETYNTYITDYISNLGLVIGTAFQIRDDLMNVISTDKDKPSKNDLKEGIYNAPVILGNPEDNYMSGIEKTKILLNNYTSTAADLIKCLPENKYSAALLKFSELLENV